MPLLFQPSGDIVLADGTRWSSRCIRDWIDTAVTALRVDQKLQKEDPVIVWAGSDSALAFLLHLAVIKSHAATVFVQCASELQEACAKTGAKLVFVSRKEETNLDYSCLQCVQVLVWEDVVHTSLASVAAKQREDHSSEQELDMYNSCWLRKTAHVDECSGEDEADYAICEHRHAELHIKERIGISSSKQSKHMGPWHFTVPKSNTSTHHTEVEASSSHHTSESQTHAIGILTKGPLKELAFADAIAFLSVCHDDDNDHPESPPRRPALLLAGGLQDASETLQIIKRNNITACMIEEELMWDEHVHMRNQVPNLAAVCVYYQHHEPSTATISCFSRWSGSVHFQSMGGSLSEGVEFLTFEQSKSHEEKEKGANIPIGEPKLDDDTRKGPGNNDNLKERHQIGREYRFSTV
jgi:hypothetical protein